MVQFSPSTLFLLGQPRWQASAVVVLADIDNWVMQSDAILIYFQKKKLAVP